MPAEGVDEVSDGEWYASVRPTYVSLANVVCQKLEGLLKGEGIDYLSVTGRAKAVDSYIAKIGRKSYQKPRGDVHDLAGVRVVAYTETDVRSTVALVKRTFRSHPDKSLDKTAELGVDRSGYRSIHLVCDLGTSRCRLPEYSRYEGLLVEIQVRTVLQHAWAEISHDRYYKFSGVLPAGLQRRLNLAAGTLEGIDREFDSIARAVDEYSHDVKEATERGELAIPIDTKSLDQFLITSYNQRVRFMGFIAGEAAIAELNGFGIRTLKDLQSLITTDFLDGIDEFEVSMTDVGFVRMAMMFADPRRYFADAWQGDWYRLEYEPMRFLSKQHGHVIGDLLGDHSIEWD